MKKRVHPAAVFSIIAILVVVSLIVAPAALAQAGQQEQQKKSAATDKLREKAQDRLEAAKNVISEEKENLQERLQERKGAAKEKVQEKREAVQGKAMERAENVQERLKEKRELLKAKVMGGAVGEEGNKVSALSRVRLKELEQLTPVQAKARLAGIKIIKAKEDFKIRPLGEEKLIVRKAAFEKLKEDDGRLRTEFKAKVELFSEAKKKLEKCGNESESDDCKKTREDAIAKAKEAALKAVDRIVTHLNKLKEKIAGSENIPEDEAAEITAKIDALTSEVEATRQKITAATTKKGLNDAVKELREAVRKVKRGSEAHSQSLLKAEINGVIHRSEIAEKSLDCSLNSLEAAGSDTAAVDAKLEDFSSKIGSAREKLKQAKEHLSSDDDAKIAEGKSLVREARGIVQEAHKMLQGIRKDVNSLGGQPCREEEQELVIETETQPTAPPAIPEASATT
ncbi:hypothetical protein HYU17_04335 [Candidatus Woesearchaeota archaeon]|nr:hypothetical protein [Candidatus Woesearchaeota archaeon]